MTYRKALLVSLFSITASSNALALSDTSIDFSESNDNGAPLMKSTDPGADKFRTVGKFSGGASCTATLIAGENEPSPETPALILTAGHCVNSNVGTNEVIVDRPVEMEYWQYTPDYFIDKKDNLSPIKIDRVLYSTMKHQDIAVLQLKATYGDLAKKGYHPLKLKKNMKMKHQPIVLTHIPVNNVDYNFAYLRKSECDITGKSPLLYESSAPWIWSPVFSVNCAGVVGGTSGSPVFEKGKTDVIGVLNTTTTPGMTGCGLGRPCTVENNKGVSEEGASYFIPVDTIANAITKDNKLDLSKLENNSGDILERSLLWSSWITQSVVDGEKAKWDVTIKEGADVKNIRYKTGLISEVDCTNQAGYSAPVSASKDILKNMLLPEKDGIYKLCVIHQNNDGQWQKTKDASVMLREIDNVPPSIKPIIHKNDHGSNNWYITVKAQQYELMGVQVKYGPKATTRCDDKSDYSFAWRPIVLEKSEAPWRVCAYGQDMAKNDSEISVLDIEVTADK
ncbi:trypsin-like serine peptidase [Xenorhabdus siamensis]|uniref:trypsin-like serine peptidase n=1 Tax=Xenorhabdus siamensis TaxID=3136254 RepID=UPI0030F4B340